MTGRAAPAASAVGHMSKTALAVWALFTGRRMARWLSGKGDSEPSDQDLTSNEPGGLYPVHIIFINVSRSQEWNGQCFLPICLNCDVGLQQRSKPCPPAANNGIQERPSDMPGSKLVEVCRHGE
jgi:hypothetical protein